MKQQRRFVKIIVGLLLVCQFANSKELTLRKMVSSLVIIGFNGENFKESSKYKNPSQISKDIKNGLGGVVIFNKDPNDHKSVKNIRSPWQLKMLTKKLQLEGKNRLIIAIDQEGGKVQRLKAENGFISTPSAEAISKMGKTKAKKYYKALSKVLYENKINTNFAPVVDLAIEPRNTVIYKLKRSYGKDHKKVYKYAGIFINEMQSYGIIPTLKHFPGHGSSLADSHKGFVDITDSWSVKELDPYYQLIKRNKVDLIMTAHVFNRRLDNRFPATMSYKINTTTLREILGYKGAVISDDLQMRAISANYSLKDSIMYTLNSGVDLLLFANQNKHPINLNKIVNIVLQLVKEKKVKFVRIREAYRRVQKLKNMVEKFNKSKRSKKVSVGRKPL